MRKKIIALFSFFILIFSISFSAYAATPTQQIEYLSDGSYIVTEIVSEPSDIHCFLQHKPKAKQVLIITQLTKKFGL